TDVNVLLADFDMLRQAIDDDADEAVKRTVLLLQDALRKSAHVIRDDKRQLFQQLFARLRPGVTPDLDRLQRLCADEAGSRLRFVRASLEPAGSPLNRTLTGHRAAIVQVLPLSDDLMAPTSTDQTLRVWNMQTGDSFVLKGHAGGIYGFAALPNGMILPWSADTTLRVWDLTTRTEHAVLRGHSDAVYGALPLDGGEIVSWSEDGTLRIWDTMSGLPRVLRGHSGFVDGVLLTHDGMPVSWSADGTIRIWDVGKRTSRVLMGHQNW